MVEQAVRIGKAAVGQVENPVRRRPRREEVRHLRSAGSYPFEPRAMLRRVHEKGETQMAWKSEWLDPSRLRPSQTAVATLWRALVANFPNSKERATTYSGFLPSGCIRIGNRKKPWTDYSVYRIELTSGVPN
jgi:hypothetical protein